MAAMEKSHHRPVMAGSRQPASLLDRRKPDVQASSHGFDLLKLDDYLDRPELADCRLIEARLSLACIQNSAREFDAE